MPARARKTTAARLPDRRMAPVGDRALVYGGWLDGPRSYLWLGWEDGTCVGTLSGAALRALAEALVAALDADG